MRRSSRLVRQATAPSEALAEDVSAFLHPAPSPEGELEVWGPSIRKGRPPMAKSATAPAKAVTSPGEPLPDVPSCRHKLGGVYRAVENAAAATATAFALWTRNQRRWDSKPLEADDISKFKEACAKHGFQPNAILPHGSYLINCGSSKPDMWKKSRDALIEEMTRCQQLGLSLYNFHPGSTCGECTLEDSIASIAKAINEAHEATVGVTAVLENMAGQGNTVGGKFEHIKAIIDKVHDKSRVGVCIDTCHTFAAGYDIRAAAQYDALMSEFDRVVGFKYLRGLHLNDSKSTLGSGLDRHEKIGRGCLGLEAFRCIMNDKRLDGVPLILETPADSEDNDLAVAGYRREISLLRSLVGTAPAPGGSPEPGKVSALPEGPVAVKATKKRRATKAAIVETDSNDEA